MIAAAAVTIRPCMKGEWLSSELSGFGASPGIDPSSETARGSHLPAE
jgi:hypothetical protein